MIENLVVFSALALAAIFSIAWLLRPALREWLERPKHRFQESVRSYDRSGQK